MRTRRTFAFSLLSLVVAAGLLSSIGSRGAGAAPDGMRVGVVDVFDLVGKVPQRQQIEDGRRGRMQAIDQWKLQTDQDIKDLAGQIEREPKATRKTKEQEYARKRAMAEIDLKIRMSDASQWYADSLEQLLAEIRAKIGEVARERGMSIVFAKGDDRMTLDRPDDFGLFVATRPVLYVDPSLDITEAVKAKLNASRPPGPASPAPSPSSVPPVAPVAPVAPAVPPVGPPGPAMGAGMG